MSELTVITGGRMDKKYIETASRLKIAAIHLIVTKAWRERSGSSFKVKKLFVIEMLQF